MGLDLRRALIVASIPAALFTVIIFITLIAPRLLQNTLKPPPNEPIAFDHSVHAGQVGIDCAFCHRGTDQGGRIGGMTAGLPDVQQCMFCHTAVAQSSLGAPGLGLDTAGAQAEIDKLRLSWQQQRPIDWERVHRLPDHTRFTHEPHIRAGFDCATCHGDVAAMGQVVQVRPLNMGDCLACHRQNSVVSVGSAGSTERRGAPTECATCHK
ncbi:MAG: cytochrome c3 family protein [Chloroflexi bacterium]|nr:cytochrome c3 family protein [Chloroflexota bacterium]